jgi:aspartate/methionine/tyrosine aminotransferase
VRKLAVNCWSCVNAPSQFAGIAAIDGPQDEVGKMMRRLRPPQEVVVEGLNKLPGVSCITPKGAFYAFPNIATGWKAKKLASRCWRRPASPLIGGPDFGVLGEGYIRLSYANSEENILGKMRRILLHVVQHRTRKRSGILRTLKRHDRIIVLEYARGQAQLVAQAKAVKNKLNRVLS